jgi:hypothetical protein
MPMALNLTLAVNLTDLGHSGFALNQTDAASGRTTEDRIFFVLLSTMIALFSALLTAVLACRFCKFEKNHVEEKNKPAKKTTETSS